MADVLIVEDDVTLALTLEAGLHLAGHAPRHAPTLAAARREVATVTPDAIVLDLGLPDGDGIDLCHELREAGNPVPLLILTARGTLDARVAGLRSGADDYLTKPFDMPELLARIDALLRRRRWPVQDPERICAGRLEVDTRASKAWRDGEPFPMTALEMKLIAYLARREGEAVTRTELLEHVWDVRGDVKTRTVDMFILRLRRYLEPDPKQPRYLTSVRGVGYRLVSLPE